MLLERGVFFWVNRIRCEYALKTFGLGDYFGTITIFHELHCLVRIKSHPFPPQKINTWRRVCERQKKFVPPQILIKKQAYTLNPPHPSVETNPPKPSARIQRFPLRTIRKSQARQPRHQIPPPRRNVPRRHLPHRNAQERLTAWNPGKILQSTRVC